MKTGEQFAAIFKGGGEQGNQRGGHGGLENSEGLCILLAMLVSH
jgi:hypothetical protein